MNGNHIFVLLVFFIINVCNGRCRMLLTTDELENHISPEDLQQFSKLKNEYGTTTTLRGIDIDYAAVEETTSLPVPASVDCFGAGFLKKIPWLNTRPASSHDINTHFYFTSRRQPKRVQVHPGPQFGLEWVDFNPNRTTVMIVHGFMTYSNASWIRDMASGFLSWADVNVIVVDWSAGGNTWKYWKAVANTWRVGSDVTGFLRQLIAKTGARIKDFHFVGHSLGAHIAAYVSQYLGRVGRLTGLDPAHPCFHTSNRTVRLDETDADFVDVIHTNGRLLKKMGLGLPLSVGHADFYPNGGITQPGCLGNSTLSTMFARLQKAICSHGRAYLLFTESLINKNCTFQAHKWDLTYGGVNASLATPCAGGAVGAGATCAEMGIRAAGGDNLAPARGTYFVLTADKVPFCSHNSKLRHALPDLLEYLKHKSRMDRSMKTTTREPDEYADPELVQDISTTTKRSWWQWGKVWG